MSNAWYISRNRQQQGPYDFDTLKNMASNNQILPSDYIWSDTTKDWLFASTIAGLFESKFELNDRNKYVRGMPKRTKSNY